MGLQRENANADAAMMTVGLIIFLPARIGLAATKDRKEELSRLEGEYDAVDLSTLQLSIRFAALLRERGTRRWA